jgi:outer membrane protein OmpA-like peptidoglycan-associated protein
MRHLVPVTTFTLVLVACGGAPAAESSGAGREADPNWSATSGSEGESTPATSAAPGSESEPNASNEFVLRKSDTAKEARGATPSKIKPTKTEAALKFFVVDKDTGPIEGIVVSLTAPDGRKYYTQETDSEGYAEVLVPVGQKYEIVYLSLGRKDIAASVTVSDEPHQNLRLTLRYKRYRPPAKDPGAPYEPRFVLDGVQFDTGKATIRPESFPRLDGVVEYLTYKKSARIEISGHTDNVGNPKTNKNLSEKRAQACRDYLVSKGIEGSRVTAVGYGDERPIASNDTEEGRQQNRRIEATEL